MSQEEQRKADMEMMAIDMNRFTKAIVENCWGCEPLFTELGIVLDPNTNDKSAAPIGKVA